MRIKLTKGNIDRSCPPPGPDEVNAKGKPKTQEIYADTELQGFLLVAGANSKTFYAQGRVDGRAVRSKIGRYGHLTPDEARIEAKKILGQMARGVDPNRTRKKERAQKISLREASELYFAMPKPRSHRTIEGAQRILQLYFRDWMDRPLSDVTREMVRERHRRISAKQHRIAEDGGRGGGTYAANGALRVFRAIYNRAMRQHPELPLNPVVNVDFNPESSRSWAVPGPELQDLHVNGGVKMRHSGGAKLHH
jgi:hypothetical protein